MTTSIDYFSEFLLMKVCVEKGILCAAILSYDACNIVYVTIMSTLSCRNFNVGRLMLRFIFERGWNYCYPHLNLF